MNRRQFIRKIGLAGIGVFISSRFVQQAAENQFKFRYMVGSSMYGELPLSEILPGVRATGAQFIDIWPRVHGNQREQMDEMGHDQFEALLRKHQVKLGCLTHYDLGPFGLASEMPIAKRFNCGVMVCGGQGPKGLKGGRLKTAVKDFAEQLKPHLELAEQHGVSIAIENHGNNLIDSSDSLKWLMEFRSSMNLKIALAPYHLETLGVDALELGRLVEDLGNRIGIFYAWQHGMGCMKKLPKEQELLQMPGRGNFDFAPVAKALKKIDFSGFTEIFMHPVPRGIPILPTAEETTAEINRGRAYLEKLL
ncbi:MAG TPA: sugar phosphate isomerase/epimerase [Verrucomicrobiales bacterium]|jgi:sugar phosphate isomerase/epimerase|nr:sugar phosphate isomerase/epimerase [Verrucomicrobiales bacterium]